MTPMIHLSQAAIAEVTRIKSKHSDPEVFFRLGIKPGGCAAFYYTMELDGSTAADDQVLTCGDVRVVVDAESWKYLNGLKLDFTEDLMGGGFQFYNPNATGNCGCGNSFSVS